MTWSYYISNLLQDMEEWKVCPYVSMETSIQSPSKDTLHWYALKVFFNKVFEVEDILHDDQVESYIPCQWVREERQGKMQNLRKTIIPSLMFFRSTEKYAKDLQQRLLNRVMLYMKRESEYCKRPAIISDTEMDMFILVTSAGDQGLEYFPDDYMSYKVGQKVRVIGGIFKGAEGYIKRIKHNRRLTVTLSGICMVATSFIEPSYLEIIDDSQS